MRHTIRKEFTFYDRIIINWDDAENVRFPTRIMPKGIRVVEETHQLLILEIPGHRTWQGRFMQPAYVPAEIRIYLKEVDNDPKQKLQLKEGNFFLMADFPKRRKHE